MIAGQEYGLMPAERKKVENGTQNGASTSQPDPKKTKVALLNESVVRLDACALEAIPHEVFQKKSIKELILSRNSLVDVPLELCGLRTLRTLRLNHNLITVLPPQIGQLVNLQSLDLQGNQLCSIPVQLGACVELAVLNLLDNPLTDVAGTTSSGDGSGEGGEGEDRGAGGEVTFCQLYYGGAPTHPSIDPTQRSGAVKRGTNALLEFLRQRLDPAECGHVQERVAELRRGAAASRLTRAMEGADGVAIASALKAAQAAGVREALLEKGREAGPALDELVACTESGDATRISTALRIWEGVVAPAKPACQQYTAARLALRKLQTKMQSAKPWRSPPAAYADRPRANGRSQAEEEAEQRGAAEEKALLGARSWEAWAAQKREAKERERRNLTVFLERQRAAAAIREAERQAERQRLRDLEQGWPSRIVLPKLSQPLHIPPPLAPSLSSTQRPGSPQRTGGGSPRTTGSAFAARPATTAGRFHAANTHSPTASPTSTQRRAVPGGGGLGATGPPSSRPGTQGSPGPRSPHQPSPPPRPRPGTVPANIGRPARRPPAVGTGPASPASLAARGAGKQPPPPPDGASWAYTAFGVAGANGAHPPPIEEGAEQEEEEVPVPEDVKAQMLPEALRPKGPRRRDLEGASPGKHGKTSPPRGAAPVKADAAPPSAPPEVLATLAALDGARPGTSYQHARGEGELSTSMDGSPSPMARSNSKLPAVENFGDLGSEAQRPDDVEDALSRAGAPSEYEDDFDDAGADQGAGAEEVVEDDAPPSTLFIEGGINHGGFGKDTGAPVVVGAGTHLEGRASAVEEVVQPEPGAVMADQELLMMKSIKIVDQPSEDEDEEEEEEEVAAADMAALLPPSTLSAGANAGGGGERMVFGEEGDAAGSDAGIEEEVAE